MYVDGFVLTVKKDRIEDYRKMAQNAAEIWKEHGALSVVEATGDDMSPAGCGGEMPEGMPQPDFKMRTFVDVSGAKDDEVAVFSFITYRDRAHRDAVNKKVMADPRIMEGCDPNNMPMDPSRMAYGGFKSIVSE